MFIKRPGPGRRTTYAIVGNDGKTIIDDRLTAINEDLKRGVPRDVLEARLKALMRALSPIPEMPLIAQVNERLVEECHSYKIARKPYLINPDGLKQALHRGAAYAGSVSLREASEPEILKALSSAPRESRFDIVRAVNELLIFAKRPFRLANPKPPRPREIAFIRIPDFLNKIKPLAQEDQIVLASLFATGCRYSELAVAKIIDGERAIIELQEDERGLRATKNKKGRIAPILPPLKSFIMAYTALGEKKRRQIGLDRYYVLYRLCKRIIGLRIHDLRHSYAVEWASVGANKYEIADYIGDTVETTERHYRRYLATPEEISRALRKWG